MQSIGAANSNQSPFIKEIVRTYTSGKERERENGRERGSGSEFRRAKRGKSEDIVDKAVFLTRDNEDAI